MRKRHSRPKIIHGYVIPKPRSAYKTQRGWLNSIYKANKERIDAQLAGIADPKRAFIEGVRSYSSKHNLENMRALRMRQEREARDMRKAAKGETIKEKTEAEKAREERKIMERAKREADIAAVEEQLSQVTYTSVADRLKENAFKGMSTATVVDERGRKTTVKEFFRRHNRDKETGKFRNFDETLVQWDKETNSYVFQAADGTTIRWKPSETSPKGKKNRRQEYYINVNRDKELFDIYSKEEFAGNPGALSQNKEGWSKR